MKTKKDNIPDYNQEKILIDIVMNPIKGIFLSKISLIDAIKILKEKFHYTDEEIKKLNM
jgi:hypothetical protein